MKRASNSFQRRLKRNRYNVKSKSSANSLRVSVFCSSKHMYVQVIDDLKHCTVASSSTLTLKEKSNIDGAKALGQDIARKILSLKGKEVFFDRWAYRYHGRISALADSARAIGVKF